jgi:hypothetical protein
MKQITLLDIMAEADENKAMIVYRNDKELARYDGRNSIPECLNDYRVTKNFIMDNKYIVYV